MPDDLLTVFKVQQDNITCRARNVANLFFMPYYYYSIVYDAVVNNIINGIICRVS